MKPARMVVLFSILTALVSFTFAYRLTSRPTEDYTTTDRLQYISDSEGTWQADTAPPIFNNQPTDTEPSKQPGYSLTAQVLGQLNSDNKRIEIDLSDQRLYAWEGDRLIYNFLVSTGKWGRTPAGDFRIWVKMRYCLMAGGSQALGTYYYLPNVPYVMYFYRDYGIHGTYWHSNFGHTMSHGCINMKTEEAEKLFWWAGPRMHGQSVMYPTPDNPGTRVVIHE